MLRHFQRLWFLAALGIALGAIPAWAENEGQADFDQATEKKLAADNLNDLGEVIDLCESALRKGLDADNTEFAKNLLTSTLMQRASVVARGIVEQEPAGWPQLRRLALADITKALQYNPDLAEAYLLSARLQALRGGDRVGAMKAAEKALELAKDDAEVKVAAVVLQANLTEDPQKKLELYNKALEIAPENDEALRYRGLFLLLTGKTADALRDLQAAAKTDPENADVQEARGLALFLLKRNAEALSAFGQAIKLVPDSPIPYMHRARVHAQDKNYKQALEDLAKALELEPDNVVALLLRARVHQQAGDAAAARADVDAALKDRPDLAPALELRAMISAGSGEYNQAISDLEELEKIAPNNKVLLTQLGWLYTLNKQPRQAIDKFDAALTQDGKFFEALRGRGDANLNIGKHAQAVADYEVAVQVAPQDSGVLNNFAWVLATSPDESVRDAMRSVELGTEAAKVTQYQEAHILSTLAAGYAESGDFEKAIEWSKKAVELGSKDPDTAEQLKKELASYEKKEPWRERIVPEENGGKANQPEDKSPPKGENSDGDSATKKAAPQDDSSASKR